MTCAWCDEEIRDGEQWPLSSGRHHRECLIRVVHGSAAHMLHLCSCYVEGSTESDPPYMTKRQAARAAAAVLDEDLWGNPWTLA